MKKITMFILEDCPYCREARRLIGELYERDERYRSVSIEMIDENLHPEIAEKYDYYFVPTFYVGDEKAHEGAATLEDIARVFDKALG